MSDLKYDGATVRMGGRDWIVPPLSFRLLKRLQPRFKDLGRIGAQMTAEQIDGVIEIVHAALSRNYPDIAIDEVENMIDLANVGRVIAAIAGVSGLVPLGEAPQGSRSEPSTGTA